MSLKYPDVSVDKFHIDILTAPFVQRSQQFDAVVWSAALRLKFLGHREAHDAIDRRDRIDLAPRFGRSAHGRSRRPREHGRCLSCDCGAALNCVRSLTRGGGLSSEKFRSECTPASKVNTHRIRFRA